MPKNTFLSNLLETCKTTLLGCCRGTPLENLEAKLPDIVSYVNYFFTKNSTLKLVHMSATDLQLWSRQTGTKLGVITFYLKELAFELHYTPVGAEKIVLGSFNPMKPSNRIAPILVKLLSDL